MNLLRIINRKQLKKEVYTMKKILCLFIAFTMILGAGMPEMVYARSKKVKNPTVVNLSLNTTYTGYDVNGDGKADTIRISSIKSDDNAEMETGLKVKINGKEALRKKECYYYILFASLYTLKNGKVYLYLYNPGDDDDAYYCGLYQYQKGKLKCVINMNRFYGSDKLGYHTNGSVKAVSGNKITVDISQQNYEIGGISVSFDYIYSKGKLVKRTNMTRNFVCWAADDNGGRLTARNSIRVYTKTNCRKKGFILRPGNQIKINGIYCKSGKMLLKVQRLSDGKTGYIKCMKHSPKDGYAPFKEVMYAG